MRKRPQSKLTYPRTFKVRPAADGFYVVDCRRPGPGKVVAWFASAEEAVHEAHARSSADQEHARLSGLVPPAGGVKAIVAGSRTIRAFHLIEHVMMSVHLHSGYLVAEVVSGGARGVDTLAERWAVLHGIPVTRFAADWAVHGKSAGPRRNEAMACYGHILVAVWDGKSRGTADMIGRARAHGRPVLLFDSSGVRTKD